MSWVPFGLALAAFVGSHYLPGATGLRAVLVARFGRRAYFTGYGLLSIVLLGGLIVAAGAAPYVELWPPAPWQRWVPNVAVPVAFVLAACGAGIAQPFTLGGRGPASGTAGFAAVTRHPLLLALALWSGAHLVPNGDLAHAIVFGGFLAMSFVAIRAFDARAMRALGPAAATAAFRASPMLSVAPLADSGWRRHALPRLAPRALVGLALWAAAFHLHAAVIGVSPAP